MQDRTIVIRYVRKGRPLQTIEVAFRDLDSAFLTDTFALEEVMRREEPTLTSIYPLVKLGSTESASTQRPTNQNLMATHGISELTYVIGGNAYHITT